MKKEGESPLCLDFGEIQANGSLITNTFLVSIPKGQYCVCRQLTLETAGGKLTKTANDGSYTHNEDNNEAIISIEDWNRAKEKRNTTGIKAPSKVGRDRMHLLTGILKCLVCVSPIYAR